ncbi:MAG: hypothetical protein J5673_03205 [Candidatus Methanomethylophilaceae archaeon]|nr:hypothetical protein [Candidatus Methanomethylophilaceae archaeon]
MTRHIHFYIIGSKTETAFIAIDKIPLNKIYVLNNDSEDFRRYEDEVLAGFEGIRKMVEVIRVDPFDYRKVYNKVKEIADKEVSEDPDVMFHMNITMGPRPAVCAFDSVAHSYDSDLYYIQEGVYSDTHQDKLIRIPIENFSIIYELKKKPKTLDVLMCFNGKNKVSNSELVSFIGSATGLSYHTKYLSENGLIKRDGIRNANWSLTDLGNQVIKRL